MYSSSFAIDVVPTVGVYLKFCITYRLLIGDNLASTSLVRVGSRFHLDTKSAICLRSAAAAGPAMTLAGRPTDPSAAAPAPTPGALTSAGFPQARASAFADA